MRRIVAIAVMMFVFAIGNTSGCYANEVIPAQEAETSAKCIKYGIDWVNNLPRAQEQAKKTHRPIFWLHILGNIDGFT